MPAASPVRSPARTASPRTSGPRNDPAPRPPSGSVSSLFALRGADPSKHYVWANTLDEVRGLPFYEQIGYEPVCWSDDGATPNGKRGQSGTPIVRMGHTLVAIDKAARDEIEQHGIDGDGGLALADEIQRRIVMRDRRELTRSLLGNMQGLRGRSGAPVMSVKNETLELTNDLEELE